MYLFPELNSCAWAGLGDIAGPETWINGFVSLRVMGHELGHNFGVHHANAWECNRANVLIEQGKIRPVLWRTLPFDGVAEAHQLMYKNEHLGKISILVGAESEGLGKTSDGPGAIRAEVGA